MAYRIIACSETKLKEIKDEIKELLDEIKTKQEWSTEYNSLMEQKKNKEKELDSYVIKIWGKSRSHDNYYRNQYGNNQTLWNDRWINKSTLQWRLNEKLFIEIRCNIKSTDIEHNIFHEIKDFIWSTQHKVVTSIEDINRYISIPFWFCLTIEEKGDSWVNLYQDLVNTNSWILDNINSALSIEQQQVEVWEIELEN